MVTALRLCPDALVVEPRMKRYSEKSRQVMAIIRSFAPGFLQVSVDEAFLDLSGMENIYGLPGKAAKLLKRKNRTERLNRCCPVKISCKARIGLS